MVRGGPANRAVRRAKIFAITKVRCAHVHPESSHVRILTGFSRARQELLQHRREVGSQGPAARLQRTAPQEERHEKGELKLISACAKYPTQPHARISHSNVVLCRHLR